MCRGNEMSINKINKKSLKKISSGFTLLEILLVVAAIGILAGIVIFAINPAKQLGDTRNSQRKVDINTIASAIYQYEIDTNGHPPSSISIDPTGICKTDHDCSGLIDLSVLTDSSKYLFAMPVDPQIDASDNSTGYLISVDNDYRIVISAPLAENGVTITITK